MCRGLNHGGSWAPRVQEDDETVPCELCSSEAAMYCQADDAFLCRECDKRVHGANFLAQRHIRCILCTTCHNLTQRYLIGSSTEVTLPSIVSNRDETERQSCNSRVNQKCSSASASGTTLKRPFLFL